MPSDAVLYQAAALCLTHPDDDLYTRLPLVREAAPQLREFTDHAALTPVPDLAAHYEWVFGSGDRDGLRLSRWPRAADGRPALSLAGFRDLYRAHGLEFAGAELPDFLPAVLEFAARTGDTAPLTGHRDGLERLRSRLTACGTPYACVVHAVCVALPSGAAGARS